MLDKQKHKNQPSQKRYTFLALFAALLAMFVLNEFEPRGCCAHIFPAYVTYDSLVLPPDFIAIHPFNYYGGGISRIGLLFAAIAITWSAIRRQRGLNRIATIFFVLWTLLFISIWIGERRFANRYFDLSTTQIGNVEYHVARVFTGDGHSIEAEIQDIVYTCTEPVICRIQFVSDVIVRRRSADWGVAAENLPKSPEIRLVGNTVGVYSYDEAQQAWIFQKVLAKDVVSPDTSSPSPIN